MWLMSHDRLLTNMERWKRWLTGCADCERSGETGEGVLHALGDCKRRAKEVWEHTLPMSHHCEFFSLDLKQWVLWMVRISTATSDEPRGTEKAMIA